MPHSFGFEAEYSLNAVALAAVLRSRSLAGMSELHRYHCDCSHCAFDSGYSFRLQRDSSCDGECISRTYQTIEEALPDLDALQRACIEADAEPGLNAGLHVHVHPGRVGLVRRARSLAAFVMWEPVFMSLAAGRFEAQRSANVTATQLIARRIYDTLRMTTPDRSRSYVRDGASYPHSMAREFRYPRIIHYVLNNSDTIMALHRESDRHNNLNIATRHGTWEHRWPNSTRSAWRIEMYIRIAIALFNPDVVDRLLSLNEATQDISTFEDNFVDLSIIEPDTRLEMLRERIGDADERAVELITRQTEYLRQIETTPPPALSAAAL